MSKLRDELLWFAEEHMERRLQEHEPYKKHWRTTEPAYLVDQLGKQYQKLCGAVNVLLHADDYDPAVDGETIIEKAADIANYAMMLADISREAILGSLEGRVASAHELTDSQKPLDVCQGCTHKNHSSVYCPICKRKHEEE